MVTSLCVILYILCMYCIFCSFCIFGIFWLWARHLCRVFPCPQLIKVRMAMSYSGYRPRDITDPPAFISGTNDQSFQCLMSCSPSCRRRLLRLHTDNDSAGQFHKQSAGRSCICTRTSARDPRSNPIPTLEILRSGETHLL